MLISRERGRTCFGVLLFSVDFVKLCKKGRGERVGINRVIPVWNQMKKVENKNILGKKSLEKQR